MRARPETITTRLTPREKALVEALAQTEGVTISVLLHRLLMPVVLERLTAVVQETPIT